MAFLGRQGLDPRGSPVKYLTSTLSASIGFRSACITPGARSIPFACMRFSNTSRLVERSRNVVAKPFSGIFDRQPCAEISRLPVEGPFPTSSLPKTAPTRCLELSSKFYSFDALAIPPSVAIDNCFPQLGVPSVIFQGKSKLSIDWGV